MFLIPDPFSVALGARRGRDARRSRVDEKSARRVAGEKSTTTDPLPRRGDISQCGPPDVSTTSPKPACRSESSSDGPGGRGAASGGRARRKIARCNFPCVARIGRNPAQNGSLDLSRGPNASIFRARCSRGDEGCPRGPESLEPRSSTFQVRTSI